MIVRPCIAIPTYNNPETIRQVVLECLSLTPFPVLVIDDGSENSVEILLHGPPFSDAFSEGRLSLTRFPENRGKGAALAEAFRFAVGKNFTHLVSMDADGQHLVSDISRLVEKTLEEPWALIIGNRKFSEPTVPKSTKFGRLFSNFWVKYQTGSIVRDSQSGFRVYPLFHVQNMKFWTRRYDFEIEALIRLLWKKVPVIEVAIDVYYPPPEERISHFRKFWDNARISMLNTCLVVLSLLKGNRSPAKTACALGLGVFVGCTPFFGFHTPIALALSFFLRLNAPLIWIGTQISLPFLAPFLIIASVTIGRILHGGSRFQEWLLGSLVLGIFLGSAAALMAWLISTKMKSQKSRPWTGRSRGGVIGNWFLKTLIRTFGVRAGYFCLFFIVPYFFLFSPQGRRASFEYWRITRPELGLGMTCWKVLRHFYRFGTVLLDRVYQSCFSEAKFRADSHGYENIYGALSGGEGAILLGAHVGSWEMAAKFLPVFDHGDSFVFVQYSPQGKKTASGEILYINEEANVVMKIYETLRKGKMICLMGDRPMDSHFELVSFFGKLAPFSATPFEVAAACRIPLVISFGFKENGKKYRFMAFQGKVLSYKKEKNKSLQLLEWVQAYASKLEEILADFPDQWFNFFPFWSSIPVWPDQRRSRPGQHRLSPEWKGQAMKESEWGFDATKYDGSVFQSRDRRAKKTSEAG